MSERSELRQHGGPAGALRVRLLGGLVVEGVTDATFGSRKARTVLKMLAVARGAPVSATALADALWDADLPARPTEQVGVLVSRLRRALGAERIRRSDAGFALVADWLDVDELTSRVGQSVEALHGGRSAAARAAAAAALASARGPVLPDDDAEWVIPERSRCRVLVARARSVVAEAALAADDPLAAELAAQAALADDPYDEALWRVLMRAQVATGRPAAALASYARARGRLVDDLGVSPDAETRRLHADILAAPAERPEPTDRGDVVGRDTELAALDTQLAATRTARVVVVEGDAGIGKTALVEHFARRVGERGGRVLVARCDELGRDLPLQPVLDALAGLPRSDTRDDATAGVADPAIDAPSAVADAEAERATWFEAVRRAVCTDDAATEALLVVDDAHVADATTRAWLAWVAGRSGRLLVLATTRPGHDLVGIPLPLGPLGVDAVGALVGERSGSGRELELHRRSGGNPLLALAISAAPGDDLPASVEEAVAAIARGLGPDVAAVVRAAAVLGADVDVDLLAGVVDVPAATVIARLEAAVTSGLLVERGHGFRFRHRVMREALQAEVGPARRALLHRDAARTLDQRPQRDPLAIAVHARLGGDDAIAARAFAEAAAVSLARADLAAAEAQLRASVRAADTAPTHEMLARVLMVAQRFDDAAAEAARALALGADASALEVAGWVAYYGRHYDRARLYADEAAARAEAGGSVHASALALGGRIRHGTGDLRGAEERLAAGMDGPPAVRSMAGVWLGQVRTHEGRPLEALALVDRALVDPDHLAHPFAGLHGRFTRVMALGQLGRIGDGLRACDDFERAVERSGAVGARFPAMAMNVRAWLLRNAGRLTEADELNAAALERNAAPDGAGPAGVALAEGYWVALLDLADGRLGADDPGGADRLLRERMAGLDSWDGTMAWHQRHRLGLLRSRLALAAGDLAGSAELAAEIAADAQRRGAGRYAALARAALHIATADDDVAEVAGTIATLRGCAALEGWRLVDELGRRYGVSDWVRHAEEWRDEVRSSIDDRNTTAAITRRR